MAAVEPEPRPTWRARALIGGTEAALTAAAAWISYESSSLFGLREGYWAAISAILVMQSSWQQAELSGRDRFVGTAIGGLVAWGCADYWHGRPWIYALAVAVVIFICWAANISSAGRLSAVTVSVIVLIPQHQPIWQVALFRFLEVSWGIGVALMLAWLAAALSRRKPQKLGD